MGIWLHFTDEEVARLRAEHAVALTQFEESGVEGDEMLLRTVTCETAGCANGGIPITFPCVDHVVCGECGLDITDLVDRSDIITTPLPSTP